MADDGIAEASIPFIVKCGDCSHVWPAAYYPMELTKIAKILTSALCPKCGAGGDRIFIADQYNGIISSEGGPHG